MRYLILPLIVACSAPADVPDASSSSNQLPAELDEDTGYPEPPELVPVMAQVCEPLADNPCYRWMTLWVPFYPWWYRSVGELPPPYSEAERWFTDGGGDHHLFRRGTLVVHFTTDAVDLDVCVDPNVLPFGYWDEAYVPCAGAPQCTPVGDGSEVHPDYPAPDAP